jgi:hypothetical protein
MGISHIFKIDDRYTSIDKWSIIGDNYLRMYLPTIITQIVLVHKTKKNKKHNTISVGHHYAQANTNNVNKKLTLLQTTGDRFHAEIVI